MYVRMHACMYVHVQRTCCSRYASQHTLHKYNIHLLLHIHSKTIEKGITTHVVPWCCSGRIPCHSVARWLWNQWALLRSCDPDSECVCIYMCVCMCVCIHIYIYICIYVCIYHMYVYVCVYIYVCVCVCMYVCFMYETLILFLSLYACVCMSVCASVICKKHWCAQPWKLVLVSMLICARVWICICIRDVYTCIHT